MRSLTGTLFRGVLIGAAAVLLAAGSVLYFLVNAQLVHQMDDSLTDKARMLALSIEEKVYGLEVDVEEMRIGEMEEAQSPDYLHVRTLDGRTIYLSGALEGLLKSAPADPVPEGRHEWHILADGRKLRSITFSYIPEVDDEEEPLESSFDDPGLIVDTEAVRGSPVVIQLFRDSGGHRHFMGIFLVMLLVTGLASLGVLSLTIWLAIKRGAEPVSELASRIESIGDDDLTVRLQEGSVLRELAPIAHKLNLFLDRLEESFSRERGFTSDAAHELRTPLAGLKSTIEVALAKKRDPGEYRETLEGALEIVNQLENLVKSLLALARLESGQETVKRLTTPLENCIRGAWLPYQSAAEKKGVVATFHLGNGKVSSIDSDLFTQVLEELFRNAVYYVDEGGTLRVDLLQEGENGAQVRITNSGSKVSPEEADRVFDRFWRGSHSRDDTGTRFGLGLPIVRKIADTMGMTLDVDSEMDGEFVVTLIMPEGN